MKTASDDQCQDVSQHVTARRTNNNETHRYPDGVIDLFRADPAGRRLARVTRAGDAYDVLVHEDSGGRQLSRQEDSPVVPVVPSHGEGQRGVDKALSELDVATCDGQVGNHLS